MFRERVPRKPNNFGGARYCQLGSPWRPQGGPVLEKGPLDDTVFSKKKKKKLAVRYIKILRFCQRIFITAVRPRLRGRLHFAVLLWSGRLQVRVPQIMEKNALLSQFTSDFNRFCLVLFWTQLRLRGCNYFCPTQPQSVRVRCSSGVLPDFL